jgi:hypothetical protein
LPHTGRACGMGWSLTWFRGACGGGCRYEYHCSRSPQLQAAQQAPLSSLPPGSPLRDVLVAGTNCCGCKSRAPALAQRAHRPAALRPSLPWPSATPTCRAGTLQCMVVSVEVPNVAALPLLTRASIDAADAGSPEPLLPLAGSPGPGSGDPSRGGSGSLPPSTPGSAGPSNPGRRWAAHSVMGVAGGPAAPPLRSCARVGLVGCVHQVAGMRW